MPQQPIQSVIMGVTQHGINEVIDATFDAIERFPHAAASIVALIWTAVATAVLWGGCRG